MKTKVILVTILFSHLIFSQENFNEFKNLKSHGDMPADFLKSSYKKIAEDIDKQAVKLKGKKEKIFLEGVHYTINELLHSGIVIYGDEVSNYVTKIADKLLESNPDLRGKLRFYTVKSNVTNAFSTYQGIIFITTGLISQLTNEAQLAYILAHEISHFEEEHVVESFTYSAKSSKNSDKILALSKFSRENELEADKLGLKLYNKAGYTKEELVSTFDVLLYSHLPFDEESMSATYFNTSLLTIPESFFTKKEYAILANENENDERNTHPNIKKRKDEAQAELQNIKDWGNQVYFFGEDEFKYVRNLCRFESVRSDIIDAKFDRALYSIYVLEKQFPHSLYLKRMKAKAWLGVAQYKNDSMLNSRLPNESDFEGSIAFLQHFLRELSKEQISVVALRYIEDIRKQNPDDVVIKMIWERMIKLLAESKRLELSQFSTKTHEEYVKEAKAESKEEVKEKPVENKELSKYDKIKSKSSTTINIEVDDSSSFHLFGISDLLKDDLFLEKYTDFKEENEQEEKNIQSYRNLSKRKKKKLIQASKFKLNGESMIYLEPIVRSYKKSRVNRIKSEKLTESYSSSISDVADMLDMKIVTVSTESLKNSGTEMFNQRAILTSFFLEIVENQDIDVLATDYFDLLEIKSQYGTDKIMLSMLEHEKDYNLNASVLLASVIFYPIFFSYLPASLLNSNNTYISFLIIDLTKGEIIESQRIASKDGIDKMTIKARIYNIFSKLK